ncbi:SecDF P1 head subdomain-containing protein [Castellaniella sp. WN]
MLLKTRAFRPALLAALLTLAGCQHMPSAFWPVATPPAASDHATNDVRTVQPVAIYLARSGPGKGLVAVHAPSGTIYLHTRPVLAREDITEAAALSDHQGGHFVGLRLTPAGAERLAAISRKNVGGLLALVIGRELVAAPHIAGPLDRGILAFEVPSSAAASSLAARIRGDAAE